MSLLKISPSIFYSQGRYKIEEKEQEKKKRFYLACLVGADAAGSNLTSDTASGVHGDLAFCHR